MKAIQSKLGIKILSDEKASRKILRSSPNIKIVDSKNRKITLKKLF